MKKLILLLTLALLVLHVNAQNDEKVYQEFEVSKPAEFPDGINAFRLELHKNITYPSVARRKGTQGNVILSFVINEEGYITNMTLLRDIGDGCGDASIEALKKITTKWQPAIKDGKSVKMKKTIPIAFKLDTGDSPKKEQDTIVAAEYIGKVEIKSLKFPELYQGCGNNVLLTGAINPAFSVINGSYISKNNKNEILVIPNDGAKTVTIGVRENNKLICRKTFTVKEVPPAIAQVFVEGKEIKILKGINMKSLEKIELKAMADKDFAKIFPDEIKYRIDNIVYILKRGNSIVLTSGDTSEIIQNTKKGNIAEVAQKAKKGDVLEIQMSDIKRTNFRGSVLPAKVSNPVITIPIL